MRKRWVKGLIIVGTIVLTLSGLFIREAMGLDKDKKNNNDNNNSKPELISSGIQEETGKETPSHRIVVESLSYYLDGETINADVFLGDDYEWLTFWTGDSEDLELDYKSMGYPMLQIFVSDINGKQQENSSILLNGEQGQYTIKYNNEDKEKLNISHDTHQDNFHKEVLQIKFEELKPGDKGEIVIRFGWCCDVEEEQIFSYRGTGLYYYKGEKGIGLSFLGWEKAKENVEIFE